MISVHCPKQIKNKYGDANFQVKYQEESIMPLCTLQWTNATERDPEQNR